MVVTGEIPDALTVRVMRAVVHPTVVRLPIAIAFVRNNLYGDARPGAEVLKDGFARIGEFPAKGVEAHERGGGLLSSTAFFVPFFQKRCNIH